MAEVGGRLTAQPERRGLTPGARVRLFTLHRCPKHLKTLSGEYTLFFLVDQLPLAMCPASLALLVSYLFAHSLFDPIQNSF